MTDELRDVMVIHHTFPPLPKKKGGTRMMVVQRMMGVHHHNACSSYDARPSYDGRYRLYQRCKSLMLNQELIHK